MTRIWCVLLLVLASAAVKAAEAATADGENFSDNREIRDRDRDYRDRDYRDRDYRDRDYSYNRGYNYMGRPSEARATLERTNVQVRDNLVLGLESLSRLGLTNQDQVSDAVLTLTKSLRRNPSQMSDVMSHLPRLIVLDGHRQLLEVLRVLSNTAVNSNSNYREASDLITEALRGRRRGGYGYNDNDNWGRNIFGGGGFNSVFRNLMDSVYNSVRPFNNNNWRGGYNNYD